MQEMSLATARRRGPLRLALCAPLLLVLAVLFGGCGREQSGDVPQTGRAKTEIPVYASQDLERQATALCTAFDQQSGSAKASLTLLPGAQLRDQVAKGQIDGVILTIGPGELVPCDDAERLATGSRVILGDLPLIVITRANNPLKLRTLADLAGPKVKAVALGDAESGSVGAEATSALRAAKLWPKVKPKVIQMPLDKIADAVASGKAEAAIVGGHQVPEGLAPVCDIDPQTYADVQLLAVRSAGLKLTRAVREFVKFLQQPQTQQPLFSMGIVQHREQLAQDSGVTLFMFCGAAMREMAADLVKEFRSRSGINVRATYTGSGCLLAQVAMSETGDLFMPGEAYYMDHATRRGFVTDHTVAGYFVPVIMVQKGNPKGITGLRDMLQPGLRVGIGEPKACAIGDFTPKVLAANGISWEEFEKNVVARFGTAPELGNSVVLGAVDACIQWDATAAAYADRADVIAFPTDEATVSPIPLGVLKFAKHPAEAKQFLEFVTSDQGKAILRRHHYTLDPAHPTYPPGQPGRP